VTEIRAGLGAYVRVHGLSFDTSEPNSLEFSIAVDGRSSGKKAEITLAHKPSIVQLRPDRPQVLLPRGQKAELRLGYSAKELENFWCVIVRVSMNFAVESSAVDAAKEDPAAEVGIIDKLLKRRIERELGAIVDSAVGVVLRRFEENHPELALRTRSYWLSSPAPREIAEAPIGLRTVAPVLLTIGDLEPEAIRIASLMLARPGKEAKSLLKLVASCSRMLIAANSMRTGTAERLAVLYRCIERIVRHHDPMPEARVSRGLQHAMMLIDAQPASQARDDALGFLEEIIAQSNRSVPIADAFVRVAKIFRPESWSEDLKKFRAVKSARNAVVHGDTFEAPTSISGYDVDQVAIELASAYLGRLLDQFALETRPSMG
jgi:hypothetical protein